MDVNPKDGAAVRLPPPLVYLAGVILGALLQVGWPFALELPVALRAALTLLALGLGGGLMAGALGLFRRTGQDPKPWESTPEIISSGVYRYTRNPMYVGMALLQIALGIGLANGWMLVLGVPVLFVVYATAIRHEEAYLEGKFGEGYRAYKQAVRRWL